MPPRPSAGELAVAADLDEVVAVIGPTADRYLTGDLG
jgi:hypothetical protein